jgi:large subunit ribosomal protein L18
MGTVRKKRYVAIFKRRRTSKTDYRKRRGLIMGRQNFLTASTSGRYIHAQIHRADKRGDITLVSSSSRDLGKKLGWRGSGKNLSSAYLTGYLLGKKSISSGVLSATYYCGLNRFVHGSRIASLIKGVKDAGLDIPIGEDALPDEDRLKGRHIASYAQTLESEDKNAFNRFFSKILSSGLDPKSYPNHFEETKAAIDKQAPSVVKRQ